MRTCLDAYTMYARNLLLCGVIVLAGCPPEDPTLNNGEGKPGEDMTLPEQVDMTTVTPDMGVVLAPGQDISIATFNVERLFDEQCDDSCGPGAFEDLPDALELNSKIGRIQRAITKIDADVIVLQEIEKEGLLTRVMEPFAAEYPTAVFGEVGYAASLDVAVISRGSLVKTVLHRNTRISTQDGGSVQFARELLELHLDIKGKRVIVFGTHFISKATNNSEGRRWAEANASGDYALQVAAENPTALVVIAGDLNDTLDSPPLQLLASKGLASTAASASPNVFYTHVFNGMFQIIDHIFYVPNASVQPHPDGLSVLRDEGRDGLANSDHASPRQLFRIAD